MIRHTAQQEITMVNRHSETNDARTVTREDLVALLNEDLAGEYQAIISYVIYSQVLKGAQYMNIAAELEKHATEELAHALVIAGQIDYLGGMPLAVAKPVKTSAKAEDMLHFDLDNENETIRRYRERVRQCEALGEFAVAEHIRDILMQEQDHQIALANALGLEVPNVTKPGKDLDEHSRINAGMTRQTTLKAATTDANTERTVRLASH
jgi:bacterioferritin